MLTPNGWNVTVELEAPSDATDKLQEDVDITNAEHRLEHIKKVENMSVPLRAIKQLCIPSAFSFSDAVRVSRSGSGEMMLGPQ